jgi:hypothetical protein
MKTPVSIFEYARMVTRIEEEILYLLTGEDVANEGERVNPPSMRPSQAPRSEASPPPAQRSEKSSTAT